MGLVKQEIDVKVGSANAKHYESLGYDIPRKENGRRIMGSYITVQIKDLPKVSGVKVSVECDICHRRNKIIYNHLLKYDKYSNNGKYYCKHCINSIFHSGKNNVNWKESRTDEDRLYRRNVDGYRDFVKKVLLRDNYTCQSCGTYGGKLFVHHLNGYNWFIEGRIDENNAVSLCDKCHDGFHNYYGAGDNTREQYEEWVGYTLPKFQNENIEIPKRRRVICYETKQIYESPQECAEDIHSKPTTIIGCCNRREFNNCKGGTSKNITARGKHYFWLDQYENMTEFDFNEYFKWATKRKSGAVGSKNYLAKAVYCITTNEYFGCLADAVRKYKLVSTNITKCCKGQRNYCGTLENGTKLKWIYYEDYLKSVTSSEVNA